MFIDKSDDIANRYNNTYHSTTKLKPVDVKNSTYILNIELKVMKYHKFEVGDHLIIPKYKNIFTKVHAIYLNY